MSYCITWSHIKTSTAYLECLLRKKIGRVRTIGVHFCTKDRESFDDVRFFRRRYVPVLSAFSGFGVYRYSELNFVGAQYKPEHVNDIEHIMFNSQLTNLIVDTNFRPVYKGKCFLPVNGKKKEIVPNEIHQYNVFLVILFIVIVYKLLII